jgi:hypothetical protein
MENAVAMWTPLLALMASGHANNAKPVRLTPPAGPVILHSNAQDDQALNEARRFLHLRQNRPTQTTLTESESAVADVENTPKIVSTER